MSGDHVKALSVDERLAVFEALVERAASEKIAQANAACAEQIAALKSTHLREQRRLNDLIDELRRHLDRRNTQVDKLRATQLESDSGE
jgi:hypothetical protein